MSRGIRITDRYVRFAGLSGTVTAATFAARDPAFSLLPVRAWPQSPKPRISISSDGMFMKSERSQTAVHHASSAGQRQNRNWWDYAAYIGLYTHPSCETAGPQNCGPILHTKIIGSHVIYVHQPHHMNVMDHLYQTSSHRTHRPKSSLERVQ